MVAGYIKVTIRPGYSRTTFYPVFVFFRFYSVFLIILFRTETYLDLVSVSSDRGGNNAAH
jgi:hypothetical protein